MDTTEPYAIPAGLNPEDDFVLRKAAIESTRDREFQEQLAAMCAVLGGSHSSVYVDELQKMYDKLSEAADSRSVCVVVKNGVNHHQRIVQAFIPLARPIIRMEALYPFHNGKTETLVAALSAPSSTTGDWYLRDDCLAHSMTRLYGPVGRNRSQRKEFQRFLQRGNCASRMFSHAPIDSPDVWIEFDVTLTRSRHPHLELQSEMDGHPLNGIFTVSEFIEKFVSMPQSWQDQLSVIGLFADVVAQAETGDLRPYFEKEAIAAESEFLRGGANQCGNGNKISRAFVEDIDMLTHRLFALDPLTPADAREIREQKEAQYAEEMANAISIKRESATITIIDPQLLDGDGEARSLDELHAFAEEHGYFFYIFEIAGSYTAAAGNQSTLEEKGITLDQIPDLGIGVFISDGSVPGVGPTPELAAERAINEWHRHEKAKEFNGPGEGRTLWATVREGDFFAQITIPGFRKQSLAAEVEITRDGSENTIESLVIPMRDDPYIEVSARDQERIVDNVLWGMVRLEQKAVAAAQQPKGLAL